MPVFYQFYNQNLIDSFLEVLKQNGFIFNDSVSKTLTRYKWPDIVLSKDIISLKEVPLFEKDMEHDHDIENFGNCIELMGCYKYKDDKSEGQIILYYEKIMAVAKEYYSTYPYGYNEKALNAYFEDLTTIVLIHEFVHWLMHFVESESINPAGLAMSGISSEFDYSNKDNVYFREGFAQLLTYLFIKDKKHLLDIFNWLTPKQPSQYKCFEKFVEAGVNNIADAIEVLFLMRTIESQSFEIAILYSKFKYKGYTLSPDEIKTINTHVNKQTAYLIYYNLKTYYLDFYENIKDDQTDTLANVASSMKVVDLFN